MRLLFTLQYLGTRYAGWQSQSNATAIQPIVEAALSQLYGSPIRIEGAGRTDGGVHARAQRAHADVPFAIDPRGLILGTNNLLPADIRITAADEVDTGFHCRFAPHEKTYAYRIWNASVADVFAAETHAHVATPLDDGAMHALAQALVGAHDFRPFTVADPEVSSTVRTVSGIAVGRSGEAVIITVTANGFLRYMVRRIAGSLIEAGRGRLDGAALFTEARWTAPAKGLTLEQIRY
jgi:tRNA pseudouridine38-40 synthase